MDNHNYKSIKEQLEAASRTPLSQDMLFSLIPEPLPENTTTLNLLSIKMKNTFYNIGNKCDILLEKIINRRKNNKLK